jgi:hypothetical protein
MAPAKPKKKTPTKGRPKDDFVSVARRLGADEDKGRFEEKLKKIAKAKR